MVPQYGDIQDKHNHAILRGKQDQATVRRHRTNRIKPQKDDIQTKRDHVTVRGGASEAISALLVTDSTCTATSASQQAWVPASDMPWFSLCSLVSSRLITSQSSSLQADRRLPPLCYHINSHCSVFAEDVLICNQDIVFKGVWSMFWKLFLLLFFIIIFKYFVCLLVLRRFVVPRLQVMQSVQAWRCVCFIVFLVFLQ